MFRGKVLIRDQEHACLLATMDAGTGLNSVSSRRLIPVVQGGAISHNRPDSMMESFERTWSVLRVPFPASLPQQSEFSDEIPGFAYLAR